MISGRRRQIVDSLQDKEYRDLFVAEHISQGIAFQIRAMREDRGLTQSELGQRVGKAQGTISQLEDPDYGNFTLKTLKRLASTFDVALAVKFVPFSKLADWLASLAPEDLAVPSFRNDRMLREPYFEILSGANTEAQSEMDAGETLAEPVVGDKVIDIRSYRRDTARTEPAYQYAQAT